LAAYECVLRGYAMPIYEPDAAQQARRLFERAIELDPEYARAHALLAYSYFREWHQDMSGSDAALDRAFELAKKAVVLGQNDSNSLAVLGWVHLFRRSYELAEHCYQKALELNPNTPNLMTSLGGLQCYLGNPAQAVESLRQARLLDPFFDAEWYWLYLGGILFAARRYDEAIAAFGRSSTIPCWALAFLAACHALTDDVDRARQCAAEVLRLSPEFSIARYAPKQPYKLQADRDHLADGLRKAGLPA